jgi:hypothetical protein
VPRLSEALLTGEVQRELIITVTVSRREHSKMATFGQHAPPLRTMLPLTLFADFRICVTESFYCSHAEYVSSSFYLIELHAALSIILNIRRIIFPQSNGFHWSSSILPSFHDATYRMTIYDMPFLP